MRNIYWFRNDLRLSDNLALNEAIKHSKHMLFVFVDDSNNDDETTWGFKRQSKHRKLFLSQGINSLTSALKKNGHHLRIIKGDTVLALFDITQKYNIDEIFCESINAPEEQAQITSLQKLGVKVTSIFQSSLFTINQLPFDLDKLPDVFTKFRKIIESQDIQPLSPVDISNNIVNVRPIDFIESIESRIEINNHKDYQQGSFPISQDGFQGGEINANLFVKRYFQSELPQSYKKTRNDLIGVNFSTKLSPWLALGFISARQVYAELTQHESKYKANESTYWIFFELLWRDFFRFLFCKYGVKFFHKNGLEFFKPKIKHMPKNFKAWSDARTDNAFINAGMNELNRTGFLSNRMRQIVASYLVNELSCDWRSGAAWFEAQLIDYDVHSNYGNWAYIAGCGTDPRGGRFFNIEKQKQTYDPKGTYQKMWNQS